MTCRIYLLERGVWSVVDLWTATRPECSDFLALLKWACACGGWSEFGRFL